MKTNPFVRALVILLILSVSIWLDQVSKKIARERLSPYRNIEYFHGHFVIEKAENSGAFLSLGDNASKPVRLIFLNVIPFLLIALSLGYILVKTNIHRLTLFAIILMIGGGIGNIYDRIIHGSVTDFLYIDFVLFHTGIFNVADLLITIGIIIILLQSWFTRKTVVEEPELDEREL